MNDRQKPVPQSISRKLSQWTSGRRALLWLALWLASALLLQRSDSQLAHLAHGATKLDLRFGYNPQEVNALFGSYGTTGRALYLGNLAIDTVMPLFLALATASFIALSLSRDSRLSHLVWIPIAFFAADIVENSLLAILTISFPDLDPGLVQLASSVTRPKLVAAMLTYALLILSGLTVAGRHVRRRGPAGRAGSQI